MKLRSFRSVGAVRHSAFGKPLAIIALAVAVTALNTSIVRACDAPAPSVCIKNSGGNLVLAAGATIDPEGGVHWDSELIGHLDPNDDTLVDNSAGTTIGVVVYGD